MKQAGSVEFCSILTNDGTDYGRPHTPYHTLAPSHNPPPGFPMIDLTKPPPGYHPPVQAAPGPSRYEQEYDEKVRRFLHETAHGGTSAHKRRSGHSRGERSKHRSRSRSRSRKCPQEEEGPFPRQLGLCP